MAKKQSAAARRKSKLAATKRPAKAGLRRQRVENTTGGRSATTQHEPAQRVDGALTFPIVGVGASAGGLEAFSQLLRALPANCGLAIVLIQHLAPKHESILATLLADTTNMPVTQVTGKTSIEPNHVYVIPPNYDMEIGDGLLRLLPRRQSSMQHMPVDTFFRSLAEYAQTRAVGVVLSGTASDGALGLKEIKAAGGITLAQSTESAKYDGMPRAAIATGVVDMVLNPEEIAQEMLRIAQHPLIRPGKSQRPDGAHVLEEQLRRIFSMLRNASGVDFTHYKQPTIRRRLQRRMVLHKLNHVDQYLKYLQQNPAEVTALYQDILIHVTRFFREPESFDALSSHVFPKIIKKRVEGQPIRIWVPGCSTGEEAYSIAILLLEHLGEEANAAPAQIFATDVSNPAVEQARSGVYPESISADVSPQRLRRFFTKVDGSYRISKQVRDMVVFARQDLTRDPPFSKLDLIVCRNVLIYLGPVLQKRLMNVFHYALKNTGFLMLGGSETIGLHSDLFGLADKRYKIYIKKSGMARNMEIRTGGYAPAGLDIVKKHAEEAKAGPSIQSEANRILLNQYAPPGVIVNDDLQIIQFRGQTGAFLEPSPGQASLHLLKMAREGLLYDLRRALNESRKSGKPVRRSRLRVQHNGKVHEVNIEVAPLVVPGHDRHFLILFHDLTADESVAPAAPAVEHGRSKRKKASSQTPVQQSARISQLQEELAASREYLQSIIQDLEAANEELQSANEEILSSNEELQSTNEELDTAKEELQSTNEELNTVNEELQSRNEELSSVNSDLVNLLSSVQIAIVMISNDLRIRRFTPMAERMLNLIGSDIGRPISDIKPNIDCPNLEDLIREAVDGMQIVERPVKDRAGNTYLMRVRPYKDAENRINGAIIALFDMEMRARAGAARSETEAVLETLTLPVVVLDRELCVTTLNKPFTQLFEVSASDAIGKPIFALKNDRWDLPELHTLLERTLPSEDYVTGFEFKPDGHWGSSPRRAFRINARRVERTDGTTDVIVLTFEPGADDQKL